jgi:SAM-dependent methyltransferase
MAGDGRSTELGTAASPGAVDTDVRGYLCVDAFLRSLVGARALKTAFELGLIDHLLQRSSVTLAELTRAFSGDGRGLAFLAQLLVGNGVLAVGEGAIALSAEFRQALRYRDLLETKLEYAAFVLPDFTDLFTAAIGSPEAFNRRARTFQLFCYDRARGERVEGADDYELTKRWMRITTCLTRYETPVCLALHDFGRYGRILDIGGNSGELALQVCRAHPGISATVFDLPLVCRIGREHVRGTPEAPRITFVAGNASSDPLPGDQDLVSFKSMLHDWPDAGARHLLARARDALRPGGTLLIFERGPVDVNALSYGLIPFMLFFRSFRSPALYQDQLDGLGFRNIEVRRVDLETPFFLVTGTT